MGDLINTLEAPGEFDALTTLRPGEPYFLLVGQWADKNRRRALKEFDDGKIDAERLGRELRKSTQAEMIAASMISFKNGWEERQETPESASTYTGHQLPEETKQRDRLQSARVRAASALNGAAAELAELLEALEPFGDGTDLMPKIIRDMLGEIRKLSEAVTPKRPIRSAA